MRVPSFAICLFGVLFALLGSCTKDRPDRRPGLDPGQSEAAETAGIELRYTIDARTPQSGQAIVTLIMRNLPAGSYRLMQGAESAHTAIGQVAATDENGRGIELVSSGPSDRPIRTLSTAKRQEIRLHWVARPGGRSKHGKEGYLSDLFGLLDGGVYLLFEKELSAEKRAYSGTSSIRKVRVKVLAPRGWQVISDMTQTPEGFDPAVRGKWIFTHLKSSNIALGHFDRFERTIGGVPVRIFLHQNWSKQKKTAMAGKAFRIYALFQEQLPCTKLDGYTAIFVPSALDGGVVSGDFWSAGQAFSFDGYEERRVWELFAHRISHCVNRYGVCGMHMEHPDERWFVEGWSSWVEVTHPLAAGVISSEQRLIDLGRRYRPVLLGVDRTVQDRAIVEEARQVTPAETEYLHYVKAPLLVQQLDYEMRRLSGHTRTVNGLMRRLYQRYGGHRGNVPLRKELTEYMGSPMNTFFEQNVKKPGFLYPVHRGFIEHMRSQKESPSRQKPALTVDGETMSTQQYQRLQGLLKHLRIVDPKEVRDRAIQMLLVMQEYRKQGLQAVPAEMIELAPKLQASVRYMMFLHQKQLLFPTNEAYSTWLARRMKTARIQ